MRATAATTSSRNNGGSSRIAPSGPRWRRRIRSARVKEATGTGAGGLGVERQVMKADEMPVGGQDEVDLERRARLEAGDEIAAEEGRVVPPPPQHVPFETRTAFRSCRWRGRGVADPAAAVIEDQGALDIDPDLIADPEAGDGAGLQRPERAEGRVEVIDGLAAMGLEVIDPGGVAGFAEAHGLGPDAKGDLPRPGVAERNADAADADAAVRRLAGDEIDRRRADEARDEQARRPR